MYKEKSFTLIELLVVIVIIGILAGVIMISTSSSINKANITKSKVFSESIKNKLMLSLVSEWNFDATTVGLLTSHVDIKDVWGTNNANSITGTGIQVSSDCVSGNCLYFPGDVANKVSINDNSSIDLLGELTVSLWLKVTGQRVITSAPIRKGNTSWMFYIEESSGTTGGIDWLGRLNDNTAWDFWCDSAYNLNEWHYVVGTFSKTQKIAQIYNNTKKTDEESGVDITGNDLYDSDTLDFGDNWGLYYMGYLDEVSLFNEVLTSAQIRQNYIAGLDSLLSNGNISKEDYNQRINELAYE